MRTTYKNEKQNKKTSAENENIIKNLNTCFFLIYKTKIGKKKKKKQNQNNTKYEGSQPSKEKTVQH